MFNRLRDFLITLNNIKVFDFPRRSILPKEELSINPPKCKIIAIANQKGGCAKTTTAINLSSCLVERGASVLLIDFDPQAHTTLGLGIDASLLDKSIYDTLIYKGVLLEEVTKITGLQGLHIAPSNSLLSGALVELAGIIGRESVLKAVIHNSKTANLYDYIIIDCSPSLSLLTINALVAATHVLIPIQAQYFSLEGMKDFLSTINVVRERLNFDLKLLGILPTIFDTRLKLSHELLAQLRGYFQEMVLKTVINMNVKITEATLYKKPVNLFDPSSRGAKDYRDLAEELMGLLGGPLYRPAEILKETASV